MTRHEKTMAKRAALASALALSLGACGDSESDEPRDAGDGPADSGVTLDMGMPVDAGPGACDPTSGGGCPDGEFCVLNLNADEGVCRTLPDMKARDAACDPAMQDCAPGLVCVAFEGTEGPVCYQACEMMAGSCSDLNTENIRYGCASDSPDTDAYGVCLGTEVGATCNPLSALDCPNGEVCAMSFANEFDVWETTCQSPGSATLGNACQPVDNNCAAGEGMCVPFPSAQDAVCYEICDENTPCSGTGKACQGLRIDQNNSPWGICVDDEPVATCDPVNPTECELNQNCTLVGPSINDFTCFAAGSAQVGESCDINTNNCAPDQGVCIDIGQTGAQCYETCALMGGTCPAGQSCGGLTSNMVDSTWGVCN